MRSKSACCTDHEVLGLQAKEFRCYLAATDTRKKGELLEPTGGLPQE